MAGQFRKTQQQIQHEMDEIHHLISQGASDEYIMKTRNIDRRQYYRYKEKLYRQTAQMYKVKRQEDIFYDIQLCKERLSHDRVNAAAKANETNNPVWAQLASELAVSILKLDDEGIKILNKNAQPGQFEEKDRPILLNERPVTVLTVEPEPSGSQSESESESESTSNDERQF